MLISKRLQTCCVLLDGSFLDSISNSIKFDFMKFASALKRNYDVTNLIYFSLVPRFEENFPKRRLLDWLSYNGYIVREKHAKGSVTNSATGLRGNLSLEIAISALEACGNADGIVLATNDRNMCAAIRALRGGRSGSRSLAAPPIPLPESTIICVGSLTSACHSI